MWDILNEMAVMVEELEQDFQDLKDKLGSC